MKDSEEFIKPIGRKTLTQEVVSQLTELIMKGVWNPGDQIPSEKDLASRFGVGRSTIRESLQSLIVIGVLETRPGGRSYVKEPSSELLSGAFHWGLLLSRRNLGDLTEIRKLVEVECAAVAAERRSEQDVANLAASYEQMIIHQTDEILFMKYDNLFHQQVAESTKNLIYVNIVSIIQSLVRLWYPSTFKLTPTKSRTLDEHELILEAIQSRNIKQARLAMQNHILSASERLNEVFIEREKNIQE